MAVRTAVKLDDIEGGELLFGDMLKEGGTVSPSRGLFNDRSGTITTAATSQVLAYANGVRKYLFVENLDQTENLWINFGPAAVQARPSILIPGNGSFVMEGSYICTDTVTVIAATAGHAFTAKESA
jgi:hypothetical protein